MNPLVLAAVLVAGALAAVARYLVSRAFAGKGTLPIAVLIVNVAGTAIGGFAAGLANAGIISTDARLILLGGVAGGLTTFSTWSLETVQLAQEGKWRTAASSIGLNLVVGLLVAVGAYSLGVALA
jgi:CrcB protein